MKLFIQVFILGLILSFSSSAQQYNFLSKSERLAMLELPKGKVDVVIDSDTYNEIDDQYALVYALRSGEKLNVKAIYAAPFFNDKSSGPADGMEKSFQEILFTGQLPWSLIASRIFTQPVLFLIAEFPLFK